MFKYIMGVSKKELIDTIRDLENQVEQLKDQIRQDSKTIDRFKELERHALKETNLKIREVKLETLKEVEKRLVEADIEREVLKAELDLTEKRFEVNKLHGEDLLKKNHELTLAILNFKGQENKLHILK